VQDIAESLPLYLHVAVLCFVAGLTVYLWSLHSLLATMMTVFTVLGYSGYASFGIFPLIWPSCPYNSGFTRSFEFPLALLTFGPEVRALAHTVWQGRGDGWHTFSEWRNFEEVLGLNRGWLDRRARERIESHREQIDTSAFGWLERQCEGQEEKEKVLAAFWGWRAYPPLWHMIAPTFERIAAARRVGPGEGVEKAGKGLETPRERVEEEMETVLRQRGQGKEMQDSLV